MTWKCPQNATKRVKYIPQIHQKWHKTFFFCIQTVKILIWFRPKHFEGPFLKHKSPTHFQRIDSPLEYVWLCWWIYVCLYMCVCAFVCDFVCMCVHEKLGLQRPKYYETVGLHDPTQKSLAVEIQRNVILNRIDIWIAVVAVSINRISPPQCFIINI